MVFNNYTSVDEDGVDVNTIAVDTDSTDVNVVVDTYEADVNLPSESLYEVPSDKLEVLNSEQSDSVIKQTVD
jgi:hypothetical protein